MNRYFEERMATITKSLDSIDDDVFQEVLNECQEVIVNGGKLIFSGLGKNVTI